IIIVNESGKVLLGRRRNSHAPYWSIPGGKLELGETFEACAAREGLEETGLTLEHCEVISLSNNLQTYREEGVHFISVFLLCKYGDWTGTPENREPEKCHGWEWHDPQALPVPHFEASQNAIGRWLEGSVYKAE
ncbi:hypothetical protein KIPB_011992, partial [Kipferlia bialata]